ncbi:hypothetical protein AAMO2058_000426800 [Amorphochlora amoebiformis]
METPSSSQEEKKTPLHFSCKAHNSEYITTILSVLQMEKDKQAAVFLLTKEGIKVTVEKDKILQASAYMKSSIFQEYKLVGGRESDREFRTDLSVLLECLQIFGEGSHIRIQYGGHGENLDIILESEGIITECAIRTIEGPKPLDFNFRSSILLNQASMKSRFLRECFAELDIPGASRVEVVMTPSEPFLSMRADGDSIAVKIEFPNDELSEVFDHFQCEQYSSNRYNAGLIQMCAKSLARIPKMDTTMIQVNAEGMLKLQHIISGKDGSTNFISYLIVPDESLEEEKEHEELPEPSYGFQLTD